MSVQICAALCGLCSPLMDCELGLLRALPAFHFPCYMTLCPGCILLPLIRVLLV